MYVHLSSNSPHKAGMSTSHLSLHKAGMSISHISLSSQHLSTPCHTTPHQTIPHPTTPYYTIAHPTPPHPTIHTIPNHTTQPCYEQYPCKTSTKHLHSLMNHINKPQSQYHTPHYHHTSQIAPLSLQPHCTNNTHHISQFSHESHCITVAIYFQGGGGGSMRIEHEWALVKELFTLHQRQAWGPPINT